MPSRSEPLKAVFLDVGQGDGAVLKTPYNQYIVVDGGPGSSTLTRYLQSAGVNRVLLIILSHPDSDHINGLFQVIKNSLQIFYWYHLSLQKTLLLLSLKIWPVRKILVLLKEEKG